MIFASLYPTTLDASDQRIQFLESSPYCMMLFEFGPVVIRFEEHIFSNA